MIANSSHISEGIQSKQPSTTTIQSRDTTPADSNFGTPTTMGPPSTQQTFVYQQVSSSNFTPSNAPAPYDPNAVLPRGHPGPSYQPLHTFSTQNSFSHQNSSSNLNAGTPGGMNMYPTAMSSMTPGNMYSTPMSAMTPGSMYNNAMTPASNFSPTMYDPHASPGPNMSPVPMIHHGSPGASPPPMINGQPPVCMPAGPVRTDPNLELNLMGLGDLPSIGSAGHCNGTCKRCCFHEKGRCQNGSACLFCHFPHEKRVRKNKNKKNKMKTGVRVA